jgi:hypothetical protein
MSKEQIKEEIGKVLDNLSDNALQELLVFLRDIEKKSKSVELERNLQKILNEDQELLLRLAQ